MNIKIYQSGLKFMLCNAVKRLYDGEVEFRHSLDHGICVKIIADTNITKTEVAKIKEYMKKMVSQNIPFNKKVVSKQEAYEFYLKKGYKEKADNILAISNVTVSMYEFEGQYNYFYSHDMPATSGELKIFDLYYITDNELVLVYPMHDKIDFVFRNRIYNAFKEYNEWAERIGINFISDVNKVVSNGKINDLITKNNIKHDMDIHDICKQIIENKKRIVLLAGPSSSGKTTTSKRVSLCLSAMGYDAIPLSLDDFFLEKDETPLDENGNKDFESVRALDLDLFTNSLNNLLKGEEVKLPTYNFVKGVKEFNEPPIKLKDNQMIVIEGLHAINPEILKRLDTKVVYKVYISPLTPLAVDRHNYISTTDNRLLRRIIRDFRTRGRSAEQSIASWQSVRDGEEKYIFPYTDTVDGIINTAFVYEIGILKVFVEPLLYDIKMDSPYYSEARRLLDNLKSSYTISSEYIQADNVLREFIGGSIFEKGE